MSGLITCRTFCNRMFKCSEYKEKEEYTKSVALIFRKLLRTHASSNSSFLSSFAKELSTRVYTGPRFIYSADREMFRDYCIRCARHLDELFSSYNLTNLMDNYEYKYKIKGFIGARIPNKRMNIQFSYKNMTITQKELDFFEINNYIYNKVNDIEYDCLVMSVPENCFFLVEYKERDYTMKRGFLTAMTKNHIKRRGEHCFNCKRRCKPILINGLDRLKGIK